MIVTGKHLEVYFYGMVNDFHFRFNSFIIRSLLAKNYLVRTKIEFAYLFFTTLIYANYMFVVENYCVYRGFFEYFNDKITFYVLNVPFEGLGMYFCVPAFILVLKLSIQRLRRRNANI